MAFGSNAIFDFERRCFVQFTTECRESRHCVSPFHCYLDASVELVLFLFWWLDFFLFSTCLNCTIYENNWKEKKVVPFLFLICSCIEAVASIWTLFWKPKIGSKTSVEVLLLLDWKQNCLFAYVWRFFMLLHDTWCQSYFFSQHIGGAAHPSASDTFATKLRVEGLFSTVAIS